MRSSSLERPDCTHVNLLPRRSYRTGCQARRCRSISTAARPKWLAARSIVLGSLSNPVDQQPQLPRSERPPIRRHLLAEPRFPCYLLDDKALIGIARLHEKFVDKTGFLAHDIRVSRLCRQVKRWHSLFTVMATCTAFLQRRQYITLETGFLVILTSSQHHFGLRGRRDNG